MQDVSFFGGLLCCGCDTEKLEKQVEVWALHREICVVFLEMEVVQFENNSITLQINQYQLNRACVCIHIHNIVDCFMIKASWL